MTPARCAACRRRLKRPTASGLGPVCEKRLQPNPSRSAAAPTASPIPVIDGQTVIDLNPFQPTLEAI